MIALMIFLLAANVSAAIFYLTLLASRDPTHRIWDPDKGFSFAYRAQGIWVRSATWLLVGIHTVGVAWAGARLFAYWSAL